MGDEELRGKYPIPRYIPPQKYESDKGEDHMYPFNHLGFNLNEVEQRNEEILSSLTLFAPFSHEDDITRSALHMERPVTPINDEIKAPPTTCKKLTRLVRRRIVPKPDVADLGQEDQKELGAIIMGEVNGIWPDIRTQVDDPFLSCVENTELQRRITVHIVTVCQQLFTHYLQKAQILNRRGVFSGPANMSRLKAQLALDANKFLNILTIRRYIVADLKSERNGDKSDEEDGRKAALPEQTFPLLSYKGLIEASRPKSRSKRRRFATPQEDIMEIEDKMPDLDTSKLLTLLSDLPSDIRIASKLSSHSDEGLKGLKQRATHRKTSEELSRDKIRMKKSGSVPLISYGETLFEELGIGARSPSALSTGDIMEEAPPGEETIRAAELEKEELRVSRPQPGTWEYQQEDLRRLVGRGAEDDTKGQDTEDDLPPLLQALTSSPHQESRRQEINDRLEALDKQEEKRRANETIEIRQPSHPQPSTVSTKLPNKTVVRTSDIRVSDRVCLSSMTLKKHHTVYNDLIDEIDPATVKKLDSNLFLGNEITEVYKEIMKTVPTDHLNLENDPLIEAAADSLDLSAALASSTLSRKKSERIVNPDLHRDIAPPWGTLDVNNWSKTPANPPKDIKGRALVNPMVPRGEGLAMNDFYGADYTPPDGAHLANRGADIPEVAARSYASWLTWWKNTINSDDYMKYLSTQESDFMGAIFHFYNSDEEDDDDTPAAKARAAKKLAKEQQAEKIQKVQEMRSQKTEFSDGFWNANAVLMGGLGREPTVEDNDAEMTVKTPSSEPQNQLGQRTRTSLISRKSQRTPDTGSSGQKDQLSKSRDGEMSRNSEPQSRADTKYTAMTNQNKMETEPTAQDRLEKVWASLSMPDNLKLDMAIKYSSDNYHHKLDDAIEVWEEATVKVVQREAIINKLENFERLASDPNRFFEKGHRGSSVARLEEARMRSLYYKKLEALAEDLLPILAQLNQEFQDQLTYQGRPYTEKMHWDRTEMLYWLQEERKQQAMEYEARIRNMNPLALNMVQLEPVMSKMAAPVQ